MGKNKSSRWRKGTLAAFAVLLLLIGAGFAYEAIASRLAKEEYPPPGRLVEAGGYKLHLNKEGEGPVTIILESGSGETSLSWQDIPEKLSKHATVVSYDRGGYGWSEAATTERMGENIVSELHNALQQEGIKGPYLLVGHSLGGMYVRLFAERYKEEVSGLVLVDARPEDDERRTAPIYAGESYQNSKPPSGTLIWLKRSGLLRLLQDFLLEGMVPEEDRGHFINVTATPAYFRTVDDEGRLSSLTEDAIRGQRLGDLPVRIIARNIAPDYAAAGISDEGGGQIEEIWRDGQRRMLELSTNAELIIAERSGHMVMQDEPELVMNTILDLINR